MQDGDLRIGPFDEGVAPEDLEGHGPLEPPLDFPGQARGPVERLRLEVGDNRFGLLLCPDHRRREEEQTCEKKKKWGPHGSPSPVAWWARGAQPRISLTSSSLLAYPTPSFTACLIVF